MSLHTSSISPPKNPSDALTDLNWHNVMFDEYNALIKNGTWILIPRPTGVNLVRSIWLYKHKFHENETLSRYKARLVANGSSQQQGIDVDETFSLVVKPATIRTVLSLAVSRKWPIHQLDVKNAFLNGDLSETGSHVAYLLIYVDDIIRTTSFAALLQHITASLHREFDMTDLGPLNYFLGIFADHTPTGLFLSQRQYALQLLERAHMVNWGLKYHTVTRPDLSYAVQQICLYMHDPRENHFAALKRILRYVQETVDFGLQLYASVTTSLIGYTDAD
ncbi:ribonuclease H-like domain-containing protein [Tanacetum coccineum]